MDIALSILRRVGLATGAFLASYAYFDNYMNTPVARRIAIGLALFAGSLPAVHHRPRRRPDESPRGFEVVVPERDPD